MKKHNKHMKVLLISMLLGLLVTGVTANAASPENVMKSPKAAAGKLVKTQKGVRYRQKSSGKYIKSKWVKVKGHIYYFDKNGYAKTGWKTHNCKKYYFSKDGKLVTGWKAIGGKKYYFWKNKEKLSGSAATGMTKLSTGRYYFSSKGVMQTGWQKISGDYYYFSPSTGKMAVNTTIGNYKVDKNGRRITAAPPTAPAGKVDIWVGDSRTVGIGNAMNISSKCIAKVGAGYDWYISSAEKTLKSKLKKNPQAVVVINFGVNDHGNISKYIKRYNSLISAYPQARIYFMSVNPIDSKYTAGYVTNSQINSFNKKLKAAFPDRYLDANTYLKKNKFQTVDGLHYTVATYKKIYQYVLSKV